jgi:hypothetical protein
MASELKPSSLDFGTLIAFVAPGFVAFHGLSYQVPTVKAWIDGAMVKEQSLGIFLFVLLASLSLGLVVSGVRALAIDHLLRWSIWGKFAVDRPSIDWSKIKEEHLPTLVVLRDGYFRHYQFYSNMMVAIVFWVFAWVNFPSSFPGRRWLFVSVIVVSLLLSARDSLNRYVTHVNKIGK